MAKNLINILGIVFYLGCASQQIETRNVLYEWIPGVRKLRDVYVAVGCVKEDGIELPYLLAEEGTRKILQRQIEDDGLVESIILYEVIGYASMGNFTCAKIKARR